MAHDLLQFYHDTTMANVDKIVCMSNKHEKLDSLKNDQLIAEQLSRSSLSWRRDVGNFKSALVSKWQTLMSTNT